jgi:hypothetical protein
MNSKTWKENINKWEEELDGIIIYDQRKRLLKVFCNDVIHFAYFHGVKSYAEAYTTAKSYLEWRNR